MAHDSVPPDSSPTPCEPAIGRSTMNGPAFAAIVESHLTRLACFPGPVARIKFGEGRRLLATLRSWDVETPRDVVRRRVLAEVLAFHAEAIDVLTGGR